MTEPDTKPIYDIKFEHNVLGIEGISGRQEKQIQDLWIKVRDAYVFWVARSYQKKIFSGKSLSAQLKWRSTSTWWFNLLVQKDSYSSNRWLNVIYTVQIIQKLGVENCHIKTDDTELVKVIKRNFNDPEITFSRSHNFLNIFQDATPLIGMMAWLVRQTIFRFCLPAGGPRDSANHRAFLLSYFPKNWLVENGVYKDDRMYGGVTQCAPQFGFDCYPLLFATYSTKEILFNLSDAKTNIKNFTEQTGFLPAFAEANVTYNDIWKCFAESFYEWRWIKRFCDSNDSANFFKINKLDFRDILSKQWQNSYAGFQQMHKTRAIGSANFLLRQKRNYSQTDLVISHTELISEIRPVYAEIKKARPEVQIIAIQHAMSSKNKMFSYHHIEEFVPNNRTIPVISSPMPDWYFVHGPQYKQIASEYFDKNKIKLSRPIQRGNTVKFRTAKERKTLEVPKGYNKAIVIAPTVGLEYRSLLMAFKGWKNRTKVPIVLCPHPTESIEAIEQFHAKNLADLDVAFETKISTFDLMEVASMVLTGNSTISLEAIRNRVPSIRFVPMGTIGQYPEDKRIPVFHNRNEFQQWLDTFLKMPAKLDPRVCNEIVKYYFGQPSLVPVEEEFWNTIQVICKETSLP